MQKSKLLNGEAVKEFYFSLSIIQEYYWEKGYRKKTHLYRTLKEKLGWKMSLESFKYHFKKEFKDNSYSKKAHTKNACTLVDNLKNEQESLKIKGEPKVVTITSSSSFAKINKHTRATRDRIE
ncbi:MAG TPA: hypothetical protein ENK82_00240 [Campylobacterales bacterium]|nr:hypothetical protein [Campylobacterales bacterium]